MEGLALKSVPGCYSGVLKDTHLRKSNNSSVPHLCFRREKLSFPRLRKSSSHGAAKARDWDGGVFEDKGHLDYYRMSPVCGEMKEKMKGKGKGKKGWNGMSAKKRMKLLKGLSKDLAAFSEMGFGLELDSGEGLVGDDDRSSIISEAAEILLSRLKHLRAEEEESMKREKMRHQDCESSSSSSSESTDSECDQIVDLKQTRNMARTQLIEPEQMPLSSVEPPSPTNTSSASLEASWRERVSPNLGMECCNMILETTLNENASIGALDMESPQGVLSNVEKRVEVCMGGKCKKLGGPALLEEFQRVVGDKGEVVGCKCMGKCKSAPNVRVSNENVGDDSLRTPSNPLYIGVGLEDVSLIVADHFGEGKELGRAVVCAT